MSRSSWRWQLAQRLEIRWWERYLKSKDADAYLAQKQAYWRRLCGQLNVQIHPQDRVLDAGCGPAGIFTILPEQEVVAIDPLLAAYEERLPYFQAAAFPQVQFKSIALEDFIPQAEFDWICCLNAINHVRDWERCLDQLTAAAKAGGQLFLGIDVHRSPLLQSLFRLLPGDVLHPQQHNRQEYRKALQQRHWRIETEHTWKKGVIFDYWLVKCTYNPD